MLCPQTLRGAVGKSFPHVTTYSYCVREHSRVAWTWTCASDAQNYPPLLVKVEIPSTQASTQVFARSFVILLMTRKCYFEKSCKQVRLFPSWLLLNFSLSMWQQRLLNHAFYEITYFLPAKQCLDSKIWRARFLKKWSKINCYFGLK